MRDGLEAGWNTLSAHEIARVFHVEEDFLFTRQLDIAQLSERAIPARCAQVLLVRQRWYSKEYEYRTMRQFYSQNFNGRIAGDQSIHLEQLFSFNPSLYDLQRILAIVVTIASPSTGNFEQKLSDEVLKRGMYTDIVDKDYRPPVTLHLGAVVTTKHNSIPKRRGAIAIGYLAVHGKRAAIVARRLLTQA